MLILCGAILIICIATLLFFYSRDCQRKWSIMTLRVTAGLLCFIAVAIFIYDLPAYIKGGENVELKIYPAEVKGKTEGMPTMNIMSIDNRYWGIVPDYVFQSHRTYITTTETSLQFHTVPQEDLFRHPVTLSYLPLSRYICKIMITIDGSEFEYFVAEDWSKATIFVCVLIMLTLLGIYFEGKYYKGIRRRKEIGELDAI